MINNKQGPRLRRFFLTTLLPCDETIRLSLTRRDLSLLPRALTCADAWFPFRLLRIPIFFWNVFLFHTPVEEPLVKVSFAFLLKNSTIKVIDGETFLEYISNIN